MIGKNLVVYVCTLLCSIDAIAQDELHIHHINVENGDATVIGLFDSRTRSYTAKVLIDGGQLKPEVRLLPYLAKIMAPADEATHFNYVILTHYHNDHYNGLLGLQTGLLTADSVVDPGGYNVSTYFTHNAIKGTPPTGLEPAEPWLNALKAASHSVPEPFVKGRSKLLLRYGATHNTSIGNTLRLGKIGSQDVLLECVAGWGNTLTHNDGIDSNPAPKKTNANNFTLAFVLTYGQFRYFIGGDMGGETSGNYIDQETSITTWLNDKFPTARSIQGSVQRKGHLCGFKANHHGSDHSNEEDFIKNMYATITVTSVGNNKSWHLPHPSYIKRLAATEPMNRPKGTVPQRGIYFTNLYNFDGFPSRTTANALFANNGNISYDFGNNPATSKASYVIKVRASSKPDLKSSFEVGRVEFTKPTPYQKLANFECHSK